MGRLEFLQVFRDGAAEFGQPGRCTVRLFVYGFVCLCRGVTVVRRNVDHARVGSGAFGRLQQCIDQSGRGSMRCRAEDGGLRHLGNPLLDRTLQVKAGVRVRAGQVRECFADTLSRLAVRHHGRQLEPRVCGDQTQQLAGNVAGTTEHNGWNRAVHWGVFTLIASITRSPSAAPSVIALNADTPI